MDAILDLLKIRQIERRAVEAELRLHQNERQRLSAGHASPTETCDRIRKLQGAWEQADGIARYDLRSEAHAAIRELVSEMSFDSGSYSAVVVVENGVTAYRVKEGRVSGHFRAFAA
ncbi:hypothetical protein J2Y63_006870 [Shinella sp. BE166]|uniref:hypothetical protein n=1 Tax=Shinella sp. BE166 TaxID=3373918 RepID=UPI003EC0430C